jgi:hypothetical protein
MGLAISIALGHRRKKYRRRADSTRCGDRANLFDFKLRLLDEWLTRSLLGVQTSG